MFDYVQLSPARYHELNARLLESFFPKFLHNLPPPLHITTTASLLVGICSGKAGLLLPLLPGKENRKQIMNVSDALLFTNRCFWIVWVAYCILPGASFIIRNTSSSSSLGPGSTLSFSLFGFLTCSFVWCYSWKHRTFPGSPKSWLPSLLWHFGNGYIPHEWLLSFRETYQSMWAALRITCFTLLTIPALCFMDGHFGHP